MKWFLVPLLLFVAVQCGNTDDGSDDTDDTDHPPDYDYPGFSRGSEYHKKAKGDNLTEDGQYGEGGPKGHHRNDYGHWKIDCGTVEERTMTIHHYGFGEAMYAVEDSTCKAVPGEGHHHFILKDVMADSACTNVVHKMPSTNVFTVEVVVQQNPRIRRHSDPVYYITCNYEKSGNVQSSTRSGKLKILENSYQQRGRRMKTVVQDASIAMNVNLTVHDKDGNERREVYMGDWIQLRSFLHSSSEDVQSYKMFHCAVESAKTTENSYDILAKGCGVGNVIEEDRGFYTVPWQGPNDVKSTSRSVFFQAFTVPEGDEVIYTCDFVVCNDTADCDGASCHRSEHHGAEDAAEEDETGERRKRALDDQEIRNTVSSPSLKIHRRPDKNKEEDNESRMEDKDYYDPGRKPIQRGGPKETDTDDDDRYYIDIRERGRGQEPEKEDKDWMHVVLIVGLSLMAVILLAAVICICLVVRRISQRRSSPSSWHQSTNPSQKELEYIDLTQGNQQSPPTVGYLYSPHWASPYGPGKPPKMEKY